MLRDVLIQKGLSNREAEVAELVTKGLSNKEVANQLFVTEKTVKFHLTNIYKKMNVKSRAQLIVWCMPHHSFQEEEVKAQPQIQAAQPINTIPRGNTTVAQSIPGPRVGPFSGSGNGNGNNEPGAGI
jgi:DNA-binding CsgD family transcriptional regulator